MWVLEESRGVVMMLRAVTDSLVLVIGCVMVIVPILKVILHIDHVSKRKYVLACVLGYGVSFLFRYFTGYVPSLSFVEYVGIQSICCFFVYILFRVFYALFKFIKRS